jgi:hypothetical protein
MTAVQNCNGAEGFTDPNAKIEAGSYNTYTGMLAVETDMALNTSATGKCPASPTR